MNTNTNTPAAPQDERVDLVPRCASEAMQDSNYLAGLRAGWNYGVTGDEAGYQRTVTSRDGYLAGLKAAPVQAVAPSEAQGEEIRRLRRALVYVAHRLHAMPQYQLAQGISLIDGDTVRVRIDGWTVEAGPGDAQPAAQPADAQDDPIRQLIELHGELLESSEYVYFELARTRQTDWMAWLCSHPAETHPDRKVLAKGQGATPDDACRDALKDHAARLFARTQEGAAS